MEPKKKLTYNEPGRPLPHAGRILLHPAVSALRLPCLLYEKKARNLIDRSCFFKSNFCQIILPWETRDSNFQQVLENITIK